MPNLRKWSTTATGNASIAGGATTINNAEGQLPSTVNNSIREAYAQIRSLYKPSEWGWVEHSSTASVASQTTVKVAANVTSDYTAGRRIRMTGGSAIMFGYIVSSSFTAETTVTLVKDSGSLSASMSIVAVSAAYDKNSALLQSGVYTPTLSNVSLINASTAYECQYLRVGNTVTVSGRVDIHPTAALTTIELGISLPIASNFGALSDCAGTTASPGFQEAMPINADIANDRAKIDGLSATATNHAVYFTFTYQVI